MHVRLSCLCYLNSICLHKQNSRLAPKSETSMHCGCCAACMGVKMQHSVQSAVRVYGLVLHQLSNDQTVPWRPTAAGFCPHMAWSCVTP